MLDETDKTSNKTIPLRDQLRLVFF